MEKDLVWVKKEQAIRFNAIQSDEERYKVFEEYIKDISEESKKDFAANLESLEEDVAIYTGLMLKVKQSFSKAKDEQLAASYELWEKFDKELPSVRDKTQKIIDTLRPLKAELQEIEKLIGNINLWNIDKLSESISNLSSLYGANKEMVEFLVKNFKKEEGR